MKHKAFTEIIADQCRVPEKTVALYVRNLKEAGLLTSGARGVNAPDMTVLDLTRMIIALCATDRPSEAVEMVKLYRTAESNAASSGSFEVSGKQIDVPEGTTIESFVESMLSLPWEHLLFSDLEIRVYENRFLIELQIFGSTLWFFVPEIDLQKKANQEGGIVTTRGISRREIHNMALPFFIERADGTAWENVLSEGRAAAAVSKYVFQDAKNAFDESENGEAGK